MVLILLTGWRGATQSLPKDLREFGMTKTVAVDVLTDDDDDDDDASAISATAGGGGLICR
ncbi:MAG TPA: hypothetical protein VI094_10585 [Propionibacteriaceae bacterium]